MPHRKLLGPVVIGATALCLACGKSSDGVGPLVAGNGHVIVQLTDAPFPVDSVQSVDVFVMRVDARPADVSDADAATATDDASAQSNGWITLAEPNASFNLLSLQNGVTATLGEADIVPGTYRGFRLIIDVSRSSVTLLNGMTLTSSSSPNIVWPSAAQTGIKIVLNNAVTVLADETTTLLVDFDVGNSFVLRGNSILQNGLLFKPVVHASAQ
jgi:hypothetical protein